LPAARAAALADDDVGGELDRGVRLRAAKGDTQWLSLIVLYKTPKDSAAFDKHYVDIHDPLVKKIPGFRRFELSRSPVASPAGASGVYLAATLIFDRMASLQSGLATPKARRPQPTCRSSRPVARTC
jgi:uncharacterized protein (TIGR02118 family)